MRPLSSEVLPSKARQAARKRFFAFVEQMQQHLTQFDEQQVDKIFEEAIQAVKRA
jgi:hypothetical protein